jgi:hypothetical protein
VDKVLGVYQRHARTEGRDAYLTSLARANLAIAYCQRGAGTDLAEAVRLCGQEIQARADRYGPAHRVLARVHRALGDRPAALVHARNAARLLATDAPGGPSHRAAEALLRERPGQR